MSEAPKSSVIPFPNGRYPDRKGDPFGNVAILPHDAAVKEDAAVTLMRAMKELHPDHEALVILRNPNDGKSFITYTHWNPERLTYMIETLRNWLWDNKRS